MTSPGLGGTGFLPLHGVGGHVGAVTWEGRHVPCVCPLQAAALLSTPSGCVRFAFSGVGRGP